MEQNEIGIYSPENGTMTLFARDPRINWVDTSKSEMVDVEGIFANEKQCRWLVMGTSTLQTTNWLSARALCLERIGDSVPSYCSKSSYRETGRG